MPAHLENSAVATGLEKVSFHSNPKEMQWQRMLKLPHNCTHLSSVQLFSHSVVSDSLRQHELQHARPPCPSLTPRVCSNSHPLSQRYHAAISSSVTPFPFCPKSFPTSGSFPMSRLFVSGGQSIGVSALASFLPMNIQG